MSNSLAADGSSLKEIDMIRFLFTLAAQLVTAALALLALWVATFFPGGLQITGVAWILAPLLVWIVTALGGWIIVGVVLKRFLAKREGKRVA